MKIFEVIESENDKIIADIKIKCSQALNSTPLFKGCDPGIIDYTDVAIFNPAVVGRKSAYTKNYYTLLIDNLPIWKKYPKRSQSIIMTNSLETADSYGDVYRVLPFDNAPLFIPDYISMGPLNGFIPPSNR